MVVGRCCPFWGSLVPESNQMCGYLREKKSAPPGELVKTLAHYRFTYEQTCRHENGNWCMHIIMT